MLKDDDVESGDDEDEDVKLMPGNPFLVNEFGLSKFSYVALLSPLKPDVTLRLHVGIPRVSTRRARSS